MKEAEQIGKRRKLLLPEAQVGEAELEEIVKIGQAGESARALVGDGSEASERLLGEYEGLEKARMARTPRTAPQRMSFCYLSVFRLSDLNLDDNIMAEARNLRNMVSAQTPLLGDENTPLHVGPESGTGFESATPRHQATFTPNPLATPLRQGGIGPGDTPRTQFSSATPLRTPLRDTLSLNPSDAVSMIGDTPRERRGRHSSVASSLKAAFANLPKPENNFELLVPEDEEEDEGEDRVISEEDAAERDAKLKRRREEEERKALARRSQAVQQGLPRPARVDVEKLLQELSLADKDDSELGPALQLVDTELVHLLQHDAIAYPLPGTALPGATRSTYEMPEDDYIEQAKSIINAELAASLGFPNASASQVSEGLVASVKAEQLDESLLWDKERDSLVFDAKTLSWVDPTSLSLEERIAGYDALLREDREAMSKEANKAQKAEKKLTIQLGGYETRFKALAKRITDTFDEMQKGEIDLQSFIQLHVNEQAAGPRRVEALRSEVAVLERREQNLQERYKELVLDKQESEARMAALEEKIMLEAEALNEAALAEDEAAS